MPLTKADAAKLVMRKVKCPVLEKDKKTHKLDAKSNVPLYKDVDAPVETDDVLDFALRDDVLTVVTTSGDKLTATLSSDELKKATAE